MGAAGAFRGFSNSVITIFNTHSARETAGASWSRPEMTRDDRNRSEPTRAGRSRPKPDRRRSESTKKDRSRPGTTGADWSGSERIGADWRQMKRTVGEQGRPETTGDNLFCLDPEPNVLHGSGSYLLI